MAIAKFIDYIERAELPPHTIKAYAKDLDRFSEYCKDHHASNIDEIEYPLIRSWIVQLVEQERPIEALIERFLYCALILTSSSGLIKENQLT